MPSTLPIGSLVFVKLFRLWAAAREAGENPLPHMQDAIAPLAPAPAGTAGVPQRRPRAAYRPGAAADILGGT